jgi:hypothetical protein
MPTVAELRKHLKTYRSTDIIAYDIWCTEDVIQQAKQDGKFVTDEQAADVLENIDRHKDANLGINWDTVRCGIDELGELPAIPDSCPSPNDGFCGDCNKCKQKGE